MLEIGIIIGGGIAFYKYAKEHNLLAWLWAIMPLVAYFTGAFVTGIIIALFAPEILNDQILLTVIALFAGALFVGIAYFIMTRVAANNASKITAGQSELLDDDLTN
jgi:uncharacterized membrane protein (DUF485 family)